MQVNNRQIKPRGVVVHVSKLFSVFILSGLLLALFLITLSPATRAGLFRRIVDLKRTNRERLLNGVESCGGGGESPSLRIEKKGPTSAAPGTIVTFTIYVTNTGNVVLDPVEVTDVDAPNCADGTLGSLAVGDGINYTCTVSDVTGTFTNTAVARGTSLTGIVVTDMDSARVLVLTPTITLAKVSDKPWVETGGTATFTIYVMNTGDVTLDPVKVTDAYVPDCATGTLGPLAVGDSISYSCTVPDVMGAFTNTAVVSGTSPFGTVVTDMDSVHVTVLTPELSLSVAPDEQEVEAGRTVTFTIFVTNTGDVALDPVEVMNACTLNCDNTALGPLAVGDDISYPCTVPNVTGAFTNTAVVSGTSPFGTVVTDMDSVHVTVLAPELSLSVVPDEQWVKAGGTATFTIYVTNTGDVVLDSVTVAVVHAPNCDRNTLGPLTVGDSIHYTCTVTNVTHTFTSTIIATGISPLGTVVTDTADVTVIQPVIYLPIVTAYRAPCNVGFEDGSLAPCWEVEYSEPSMESSRVECGLGTETPEGSCVAQLGARYSPCNQGIVPGVSSISQTFALPLCISPTIRFAHVVRTREQRIGSDEGEDKFQVSVRDGSDVIADWAYVAENSDYNPGPRNPCAKSPWGSWQSYAFTDLGDYAGQDVTLIFQVDNHDISYGTYLYLDNIEVYCR